MNETQLIPAFSEMQQQAHLTEHASVPWVPIGVGRAFKPLRFFSDNRGFVELLRLDPGSEIAWHRHTGEVHAINLEGERELHTGERVHQGDYVYEPPGNKDRWVASGDKPLIVFVVVMGAVDYLGEHGEVAERFDGDRLHQIYLDYCLDVGIEVVDLMD